MGFGLCGYSADFCFKELGVQVCVQVLRRDKFPVAFSNSSRERPPSLFWSKALKIASTCHCELLEGAPVTASCLKVHEVPAMATINHESCRLPHRSSQ